MPVYKLTPADKDMSSDEAALIVRDFGPAIQILDDGGNAVEVEMTEQQAADFQLCFADWQTDKKVYADINRPEINLENARRLLSGNKPQP